MDFMLLLRAELREVHDKPFFSFHVGKYLTFKKMQTIIPI